MPLPFPTRRRRRTAAVPAVPQRLPSLSLAPATIGGPTLSIGWDAWGAIMGFTRYSSGEVNGFAYLQEAEGHNFHVLRRNEVFITEQDADAGAAHVTGEMSAMAEYKAITDGHDGLMLQWHSHVWGDAYHSLTDERNIERAGQQGGAIKLVSLVVTKWGDAAARLDVFHPERYTTVLHVNRTDNPDWEAYYAAEVAAKVTLHGAARPAKSGQATTLPSS